MYQIDMRIIVKNALATAALVAILSRQGRDFVRRDNSV